MVGSGVHPTSRIARRTYASSPSRVGGNLLALVLRMVARVALPADEFEPEQVVALQFMEQHAAIPSMMYITTGADKAPLASVIRPLPHATPHPRTPVQYGVA